MDLTFFPARAKWRSSQSPRRGVPWLCLTGADIVRDGVTSRLHSSTLGRGEANRLLSRVLLTLQNSQDRNYCVPVPCRRWHAVQLVDLAKIADCLHVAAVHSKHELALRSHHPHQPLRI